MDFRSYDGLIYKMQRVDPLKIDLEVARDIFENKIKNLTPHFNNPDDEHYKECQPYVPFMAWLSQLCMLVVDAKQEHAY